jgi:hypothetical protein
MLLLSQAHSPQRPIRYTLYWLPKISASNLSQVWIPTPVGLVGWGSVMHFEIFNCRSMKIKVRTSREIINSRVESGGLPVMVTEPRL